MNCFYLKKVVAICCSHLTQQKIYLFRSDKVAEKKLIRSKNKWVASI